MTWLNDELTAAIAKFNDNSLSLFEDEDIIMDAANTVAARDGGRLKVKELKKWLRREEGIRVPADHTIGGMLNRHGWEKKHSRSGKYWSLADVAEPLDEQHTVSQEATETSARDVPKTPSVDVESSADTHKEFMTWAFGVLNEEEGGSGMIIDDISTGELSDIELLKQADERWENVEYPDIDMSDWVRKTKAERANRPSKFRGVPIE